MRPGTKVGHEAVTRWILMDVADEALEIAVGIHGNAVESPFEEAAGPFICLVDRLCIPTEEVGKGARVATRCKRFRRVSLLLARRSHSD